jgi:hypothetical protein
MITARWGNRVAGVAVGLGLVLGPAGLAGADPSLVPSPTPKPTTTVEGGAATAGTTTAAAAGTRAAGDVLDQLAEEYAIGSGGGQLSNLLKASLKMRAMGYRPSKANLDALSQAMQYRPNQIPMIQALKDTIAYQQKVMAQTQLLRQAQSQMNANSAVMGAGQMPSDSNPALIPGAPVPGAQAPMQPPVPMSP